MANYWAIWKADAWGSESTGVPLYKYKDQMEVIHYYTPQKAISRGRKGTTKQIKVFAGRQEAYPGDNEIFADSTLSVKVYESDISGNRLSDDIATGSIVYANIPVYEGINTNFIIPLTDGEFTSEPPGWSSSNKLYAVEFDTNALGFTEVIENPPNPPTYRYHYSAIVFRGMLNPVSYCKWYYWGGTAWHLQDMVPTGLTQIQGFAYPQEASLFCPLHTPIYDSVKVFAFGNPERGHAQMKLYVNNNFVFTEAIEYPNYDWDLEYQIIVPMSFAGNSSLSWRVDAVSTDDGHYLTPGTTVHINLLPTPEHNPVGELFFSSGAEIDGTLYGGDFYTLPYEA